MIDIHSQFVNVDIPAITVLACFPNGRNIFDKTFVTYFEDESCLDCAIIIEDQLNNYPEVMDFKYIDELGWYLKYIPQHDSNGYILTFAKPTWYLYKTKELDLYSRAVMLVNTNTYAHTYMRDRSDNDNGHDIRDLVFKNYDKHFEHMIKKYKILNEVDILNQQQSKGAI